MSAARQSLSFVHCANENSHNHRRDAWIITCSSGTAADGGARVKGWGVQTGQGLFFQGQRVILNEVYYVFLLLAFDKNDANVTGREE